MLKAARAFTHACLSSHSKERGFRPPFDCCHRSDRILRCPKCGSARMGITVLSSWVGTGGEKLEDTASYPFKPHTGGLSQNGRVEAFIISNPSLKTTTQTFQVCKQTRTQTERGGGPNPPKGDVRNRVPLFLHNRGVPQQDSPNAFTQRNPPNLPKPASGLRSLFTSKRWWKSQVLALGSF